MALSAVSLLPVLLLTLVPVDRQLFMCCEVAWSVSTVGRVELAANALSAAIETFQALVPALGRSCSTNDWLSNTIGVVIGVLLGWLALRLARATRSRANVQR